MSALLVGPGGAVTVGNEVEVKNSSGPPLDVNVVAGGGGGSSTVDVTDRAARLVGHVTVDALPTPVAVNDGGGSLTVDGLFLTDAQLRAIPVPVSIPTPTPVTDNGASLTVDASDLDIRPLALAEDNVRQTPRPMTAASTAVAGPVADQVVVAVAAGQRLRLLRNAGHCDPALASGTYPTVTVKVGATTIFVDKLEPGLPWSETVCFEGASGDDLTVDVSLAATVFLNMRYELFS